MTISTTLKSPRRIIGMPDEYPMHFDRVGELVNAIKTSERVHDLIKAHISELEALQEKDCESFFKDTAILKDTTSEWYRFAPGWIDQRLGWFRQKLGPTVDLDAKRLLVLQDLFLENWHCDTSTEITDIGKQSIATFHKTWKAIVCSLDIKGSVGPYRIGMRTECDKLLQELQAHIESMYYTMRRAWKTGEELRPNLQGWLQSNALNYSFELPPEKQALQPDSVSNITPSTLPTSLHSLHLQSCTTAVGKQAGRLRAWLRTKAYLIVPFLVVATIATIVYYVYTRDVQTSCAIAGVILTAGGIITHAFYWTRAGQGDKPGGVKLP